jgi:hypothetical protein
MCRKFWPKESRNGKFFNIVGELIILDYFLLVDFITIDPDFD